MGEKLDEKLVAILPRYPALWDKSSKQFRNKQTKENCWREISATLGSTVEHLAFRYKSLREKYRREKLILTREYKSGTSPSQREPWALFKGLAFLENQIKPRKTTSNASTNIDKQVNHKAAVIENQVCTEEEKEEQHEQQIDTEGSISPLVIEEIEQEPSTSKSPSTRNDLQASTPVSQKKRKKSHVHHDMSGILNRLTSVAERSVDNSEVSGPYYHFGLYVGETLAKLPEIEADLAVEDITAVLLTAKRKSRGQII